MILPPGSGKKFVEWAQDQIDVCSVSMADRLDQARQQKLWLYTGSPDGNSAILNRMHPHVERMSGYLYSSSDLRFQMDFEHDYDGKILDRAAVAAKVLSREFQRRDIDMQFGAAVYTGLAHGACIPKLMYGYGGSYCKLVMPWQMGVYNESINGLDMQEAILETSYISKHQLWRRISHLPDAQEKFRRAVNYARPASSTEEAGTYFHQVLLAGTQPAIQTQMPYVTQPGGVVQVTPDQTGATVDPTVAGDVLKFHELWVLDDVTGDYTTIQLVEPDILIAPIIRRRNMFVPHTLPYVLVQPNFQAGYFWGRSEMADLYKLQNLLRDRLDDVKKMMALQYDQLLAFIGFEGMNDERYDQFKQAGWIAQQNGGAKVENLTPKLPDAAFTEIQEIMSMMDEVSGFANILSGQGEPGVRAGNHAQMLLKTASPRMRDRSLLVERQCADLADKLFQLLAAKDATAYWSGDKGEDFLLSQLPEDYRIMVDSHSSSPVYADDHKDIAGFLAKLGVIDGESVLDLLPIPIRDLLKARLKQKQEAQAMFIQQHPEVLQQGKKKRA